MPGTSTDFLQQIELFSVLDEGEVRNLHRHLHPHALQDGEVLFQQGDQGS